MKIEIDDEGYVAVYDDCADTETWQQVGHIVCRAAIETLSALVQAGVDFDNVMVLDEDMQFMFTVRILNPKDTQQTLEILRDELQTALKRWNKCGDPDYWQLEPTEAD
jgi:hypothetical protein